MTSDLSSSNNNLLKSLSSTVMQDSWLEGMYGKSRTESQGELKKIFTVIDDNNVSTAQKRSLESRAEVIKDKLDRLEAQMAVLADEINSNAEKIKKSKDELADIIANVGSKSVALERQQKANVSNAISDVFDAYERGTIGKDAISAEIITRVRNGAYKMKAQGEIESLLNNLDSKQGEISALVNKATGWIDQKNLLQSQFSVVKTTYEMLNLNISQIGNTETNYTNSDSDTKIPIYSLAKTEIIGNLFENSSMNVQPGANTNYNGGNPPTLDSVKEKYNKYLNVERTPGVDKNSIKNEAVVALGNAVNEGMLQDLSGAGLGGKDIANFLAENFAGANISMEDGKLSIPYGHGAKAKEVFTSVNNFLKSSTGNFLGTQNTWDPNKGNTISSNKQISALNDNWENILSLLSGDPKFTFKEAMFALFDKDKGLFKDSGINYDLGKQGPNYSIDPAGDCQTSQMYTDLAAKIKEIWGVEPDSCPSESKQFDEEYEKERKDPLTFRQGNSEFAFVLDRNSDGAFNDTSEFLGAKEGSSWLDDLKGLDTNADGKLTSDELKNLKVLKSNYKDNNETTSDEQGFLRSETTNIGYEFYTANSLGIEEIDLSGLENNVNSSKGKTDINGSELFNDSFSFKLNGEDITAQRKDDTNAFMEAVYSNAYNKNFEIGLTEQQADEIIGKVNDEADAFASQFDDVLKDVEVLKGAPQMAQNAKDLYSATLGRIERDENAQLVRAGNKAASFDNVKGWNALQQEIIAQAQSENITITADLIEQTKGMYAMDESLTAKDIVDKYKQQIENERKDETEANLSEQVWNTVVLCTRNGVTATSNEILELFTTGQANNAQEAVNILKNKQTPDPTAETPDPTAETPDPTTETPDPTEETPNPTEETPDSAQNQGSTQAPAETEGSILTPKEDIASKKILDI